MYAPIFEFFHVVYPALNDTHVLNDTHLFNTTHAINDTQIYRLEHRFDSVHDLYGPGALLGWFLTAYAIALDPWLPSERGPSLRFLKDLVLTLAFPALAAGHLTVQFARFPGARHQIWSASDHAHVQHAAAIHASAIVCVMSLGVNIVLAGSLPLSTVKCRVVLASSLWLLLALIVASSVALGMVFSHFVATFAIAMLFAGTPWLLLVNAVYISAAIQELRKGIVALIRGRPRAFLSVSCRIILLTLVIPFLWVVSAVILYGLEYHFFIYWSRHSFSELGQVAALCFGLLNLSFPLFIVAKAHRKRLWGLLQGRMLMTVQSPTKDNRCSATGSQWTKTSGFVAP